MHRSSRRNFIGLITGAALAAVVPWPRGRAQARPRTDPGLPTSDPHRPLPADPEGLLRAHPDPRPGIDGSNVLTAEELVNAPHLVELFDQVREIPHIVDGILCYCGCVRIEGYRSLLSCYEDAGMAQHCDICQAQGRLAYGRWKEGQTLDQIRRATDARFGHGSGAHRTPAAAGALLLAAAPMGVAAQAPEGVYRISQRAAVSQTLGTTDISLDYSRPLVRGRTGLFGEVVHWGELWTPGANEATVLEVSDDVELNGHAVPAGRWSMWIIPSQVGPWELVLDPRDTLFHTQRPELLDDQIRLVVDVRDDAPGVEALTWSFPRIAQDGATLEMTWGTTRIPIEVAVEPSVPALTVVPDEAAAYVGEWRVSFATLPEGGPTVPEMSITVRHGEDGTLHTIFPPGAFAPPGGEGEVPSAAELADMTPQEREPAEARRALAAPPDGAFDLALVPRARGVFLLGILQDGVLLDVEEVYHEFEFEGDRAVRLTIRGPEDQVLATATRGEEGG